MLHFPESLESLTISFHGSKKNERNKSFSASHVNESIYYYYHEHDPSHITDRMNRFCPHKNPHFTHKLKGRGEMEPSRSFRIQRGTSFRIGRSYRSALVSETITSEYAGIARYERFSESMRLSGEHTTETKSRRNKDWGLLTLSKVFSFRKSPGAAEAKQGRENVVKKKKKRSSWLPDPDRRWPVQGW